MTSRSALYRHEKSTESDAPAAAGVFTEEQRRAVRKRLMGFANEKRASVPEHAQAQGGTGKKVGDLPLLVDQEFHTSFNLDSYRPELDEVPHLFLLRLQFVPYYRNKTASLELEKLRFLAEMCGVEGTMLEETERGYRLSGEMARGGPVKRLCFLLTKCVEGSQRRVRLKDIVFMTTKEGVKGKA